MTSRRPRLLPGVNPKEMRLRWLQPGQGRCPHAVRARRHRRPDRVLGVSVDSTFMEGATPLLVGERSRLECSESADGPGFRVRWGGSVAMFAGALECLSGVDLDGLVGRYPTGYDGDGHGDQE